MPMNGSDHAAEAVDQQVAAQERGRADRTVADAPQRERDQAGMTSALKMIAEMIALGGVPAS